MNRIPLERLQAMLDYANKRALEEDCVRRLQNRSLARELEKKESSSLLRCERSEHGPGPERAYILEAWGGDIV